MTRRVEPRLAAYLATGAAAVLAGVTLAQPGLVAVGAPFLLFVLAGVLADHARGLTATIDVRPSRLVEGEPVTATIRLAGADRGMRLRVTLPLPAPLGSTPTRTTSLARGESRTLEIPLRPARWGGFVVGPPRIEATDVWGLFTYAGELGAARPVRVYPRRERLGEIVAPRETRDRPGTWPSRAQGEGLELAGLRPFAPGDRVRRVNWRATARLGEPYVTERLLERSADVVLLLDTFAAVSDGADGTLEQTVRAADALAAHHLAQGDRVGVVGFGGVLSWLSPGGGARARARIVETLIETELIFSYAWKDVRVISRRALPANAVVVAITPLLDERGVNVLFDLRGRRFDVAAIVVPPFPYVRPASTAAGRLWRLQHDALRLGLARRGIAVAEWRAGAPLAEAVGDLALWRRAA